MVRGAQLAYDACCNDSPTEYSETLPTLTSKVHLEKYLYPLCLVGGMVCVALERKARGVA